MPWFDPLALDAETALWISPSGTGSKHIVGRWPHPNVLRTSADYIMDFTEDLSHVAYRRLFRAHFLDTTDAPSFPNHSRWGHWDVGIFQQGWMLATSDVNDMGWQMSIEIQQAEVLPVLNVPGVRVLMKCEHPASEHFVTQTWEYRRDTNSWRFDRDQAPDFLIWKTEDISVGFPYAKRCLFDYAMSDCYLFPRLAQAPLGKAEFNGVDAYIGFDDYTDIHTDRFMLEFDIYLYDLDEMALLGPLFSSSKYVRFKYDGMSWRSSLVLFSPTLPLNEWMTIRIEWNWDSPTSKWKVFKDDVLIGTNTTQGASGLRFNQMGRRGSIIQGVFDMRNLHWEDTDPAAPEVLWSCLLQDDACDTGPKLLKGTTFNMALPSCP